jgi:hypothetical protein
MVADTDRIVLPVDRIAFAAPVTSPVRAMLATKKLGFTSHAYPFHTQVLLPEVYSSFKLGEFGKFIVDMVLSF